MNSDAHVGFVFGSPNAYKMTVLAGKQITQHCRQGVEHQAAQQRSFLDTPQHHGRTQASTWTGLVGSWVAVGAR